MHLVEHRGRLGGQAVKLLIQIRLADGQQPNVPVEPDQSQTGAAKTI